MLEGLNNNEQQEAWDVVQALDSANFDLSSFEQWRKAKAFQVDDVGRYFTYKGTYGYVQIEIAVLDGKSRVVLCTYTPYTNTRKKYGLVIEGVSTSGKSLSQKDLDLLKLHRYKQVENLVTAAFAEDTGQRVEPQMKLRDDLGLDEDDIPVITMQLEDEFDCLINDEDIERFETVEDVISFIRKAKGIST